MNRICFVGDDVRSLFLNRVFDARPHPNPLPRGEGTATTRFASFGRSLGKSCHGSPRVTANNSPSPGGEGQGDGGRLY
jgi:hypothetical protein